MQNSGVHFVGKGEESVLQLAQSCTKQKAMVMEFGGVPSGDGVPGSGLERPNIEPPWQCLWAGGEV